MAYSYVKLEINLSDLCFQRMLLGLDAEFVALSPAEKVRLPRWENMNLNFILCFIFVDGEFNIHKICFDREPVKMVESM